MTIANDMRDEFLLLYDKATAFDAPGYTDAEISDYLSKGEERVVFKIYNPKANKYFDGFEETERRRKDLSELVRNAVLEPATLSDSDTNYPNGYFVPLPTDFMFAIAEDCLTSESGCLSDSLPNSTVNSETVTNDDGSTTTTEYKRAKVKPVAHDLYVRNINNPWKKPHSGLVWRMDYSRNADAFPSGSGSTNWDTTGTGGLSTYPKRHELITDGSYTIKSYHLRYLRRPQGITVDATDIGNQVASELDPITWRAIVDEAVKIATGSTRPQEYQIKLTENNQSE